MAVLDITKKAEAIDEIRWCDDEDFNLSKDGVRGVKLKDSGHTMLHSVHGSLLDNVEEVENLIKALQKTIDLGWFN